MSWSCCHRTSIAKGLSLLVLLALSGVVLSGCSKKKVDPIEYVKAMIPRIQKGLNDRDIPALRDMGTTKFEANGFINDVYSRGVRGDVSLALIRVRYVPGDLHMILRATFGGGSGGVKELTLYFAGENKWKIDTYGLRDTSIPPPLPGENILDSVPPQAAPANPS